MDVLDEILSSLRLSGGVVIDGEFTGDYCVRAQFTPDHCAPWFPTPQTLISYHYIRSGRTVALVDGLAPVELGAGSIVILPRNEPHMLASRTGLPPADVNDITWTTEEGIHRVSSGTPGEKTEVWCGFLGTADADHPLIQALPPLLTLNMGDQETEWLESSLRFLSESKAAPEVVARLAEVFLAQAIRKYVARLPANSKGWLRGLTDPAVSRALTVIHNHYADDLDVETLAREAGVSRSILGERFAELLGESPMRYCARWRMRMACNLLRDGKQNSASVAHAVGFGSEAAFNRAFKREFGVPPATWRKRIEAEEAGGGIPRPLSEERILDCLAADGTRIAYAIAGDGFPLVKAPNWMTHIEIDPVSPAYRHWIDECTRANRFIRSDLRGFGLSDWEPRHFDFEHMVGDLAAVVDAAEVETCDLIGLSHGGAIALAYAARHPERVRKIVVVNGFAAGWRVRADPEEIAWRESLAEMNRRQPSFRRSRFGEMFITLYYPSASQEIIDWHNEHFNDFGPVTNIDPTIDLVSRIDIRGELHRIRAPTLFFHSRLDGNVPLAAGRQAAEGVAGSGFVELDSANHFILADEPAWEVLASQMRAFLAAK